MFVEILDQVTEKTWQQCQAQGSNYPLDFLPFAIRIWCSELDLSKDETNYILIGYNQQAIINFVRNIYKEGTTKKKVITVEEQTIWRGKEIKQYLFDNTFYKHIEALFDQVSITMENVKFIVLLAFGVTAVGYCIYRLNHSKQQQTSRREELGKSNSNPSSFTVQPPTVQASPVQRITNQFLVLVVSASQEDFLELLKLKGRINVNDGEELYKITKYLWLGNETKNDFNQKKVNINMRHKVLEGKESEEYDIYLMYIELKQSQAYEGFKKDVSQVDRHEAFRKFDNLVEDFEISPRLQMEAYENFEVYNR